MRNLNLVALSLLAFSLLALVACTADSAQVRDNFGQGGTPCLTSNDCQADEICIARECRVQSSTRIPSGVGIEITPPEGSLYRRTQVVSATITDSPFELRIPEPTLYDAELHDPESAFATVAAHVTILGQPRIPGREVDVSDYLLTGTKTRLRLLEGTYTVRFSPSRSDRPAFDFTGFTVRPSEEVLYKRFELPVVGCSNTDAPLCYRRLTGRIHRREDRSVSLPNVEIRAIAPSSGLASTAGISDSDGRYEVFLPASGDTEFELTATPPDVGDQPIWLFREIIAVGRSDRTKDVPIEPSEDQTSSTRDILFRIVGRANIDADGKGSGEAAESDVDIASAEVTLTATVTAQGRPALHQRHGITDAKGFLHIEGASEDDTEGNAQPRAASFFRTKYRVTVIPPRSARFRSMDKILDLSSSSASSTPVEPAIEALILSPKVVVEGLIESDLGVPIEAARVDLIPLGLAGTQSAPLPATTTENGRYLILAEPGRYLVRVEAPPSAVEDSAQDARAPAARPKRFVAHTIPDDAAAMELPTIALINGFTLNGRVLGADTTQGIPDASVELFLAIDGRLISIGDALTDDSGNFTALAPNTL
ncbi:MAG: carboxypeptidase regulatory-like domain-containing protein [Deltaproteobacteria bacterium]|nr:carboxypeptidase regulatory-like domain-containing protein [Deltaproteobacteria bacterium]